MKSLLGVAAALALLATPFSPAFAKISKSEIAQALSAQGYAVRDFQPNMLVVSVGDQSVLIGIDGSDGDISYITYISGLTIGEVGHAFLSRFNSEVKFGRAYVDRDGDIAIQMDRNAAGGVTIKNIESDFDVFLLLVSKFLSDVEARASA
jgi:hypothetical protein